MQEITLVKRSNRIGNYRSYNEPAFKVEYPTGVFLINNQMAEALNVKEKDGLMFGFNQSAKTGYVVKDTEPDAFVLTRKDKYLLKFTAKGLLKFFIKTFDLKGPGKQTFYFTMSSEPNEKGLFEIKQDLSND
jgi:hypothetical protein